MRFVWAFIWSFLLVQMISYVIGAMTGNEYNFANASIMSVVFAVLVIAIGSLIPNDPVPHHEHH
ncbi:YjzD family protein [Ectobacillus ponti]|uniref:YjzD family protein n=1 Tax=Ectobacillus ponti TaxID=2961894 RepID=A0AA42BSB9_9BACI|nr:YjzD family protein [Ectobacillus ponti]MCP8968293.1 YjzD family protein [Ectobacillus ponti]